MTTRQASLATGLSLIFEIAVTTVLFRPVSLTYLDLNRIRGPVRRRARLTLGALEVIAGRGLAQQRIDEVVPTAREAVRLQQYPVAV